MAGFDFNVPVTPNERNYAKTLLRYIQRLAKDRLCTRPTIISFRWSKPNLKRNYHHYIVTVDGDFTEIQAFCMDISWALIHFDYGFRVGAKLKKRSLLSQVIPLSFLKALMEFNDELNALTEEMHKIGIPILPNTYLFKNTGIETVDSILGDLSVCLINWRNGKLSPNTLTEHLHTGIEILLKKTLKKTNRGYSFADLSTMAKDEGIISDDEYSALISLKNMRRDSKHRGQSVTEERLMKILEFSFPACHKLISVLCQEITCRST